MLAAAHRLRRSSEFAAVLRGGRRAGRSTVVVHLSLPEAGPSWSQPDEPSPEPARGVGAENSSVPTRAGFVVSKAVGNAVVRNTVRRRLRHLVRERLTALPSGTVLVVRALPAAASASYARLEADLDSALAAARDPRRSGRRSR